MEGVSPGRFSVESGAKKSSISSGGRNHDRKEFLRRFVDRETLKANLATWFEDIIEKTAFDVPFELIDLQKFDYALEGVQFQQLFRMPSAIYASTSSSMEETAYPALEDFLHTSANSLWEAFWGHENDLIPFYVSSLYDGNLKFYPAEETISKGKLSGVSASAIMLKNPRHPQGKWDDVVELALLRRDVGSYALKNDSEPPFSVVAEALFFALRVLVARSMSRSNIPLSLSSVYILIVDSEYGSVVKVEGDINKLDFDLNNVYGSAATWFKDNSSISISPVDRIWNKLGNANWGDIGALQVLYSTFHSISQYAGMPNTTVEDLAADHSSRLQTRRLERQQSGDSWSNTNGQFRLQHRAASTEIVEVQEDTVQVEKPPKLEAGNVLLLEDSTSRKNYCITEVLDDGDTSFYVASSVEDPTTPFYLYIGSHPSQLEPVWEDMKLWYQVQRQTKVLGIIKQKGISSKHLPELIASGRVVHPGPCRRLPTGSNCSHPWCSTPVLLTSPVGTTVADLARAGQFGPDEAIRCCHDCLSALSVSASAGVRHGDLRPENLIRVKSGLGQPHYYVLISWGHAILEERDRPALSLHFSSTSALQEGKLCPASDAESLVYLIYFSSGGDLPVLDSVEGALQWRETAWSRRLIQQTLGEISAVLKAFADYVDSLCGTPYPVDYEIWLRRLRRHIREEGESGRES